MRTNPVPTRDTPEVVAGGLSRSVYVSSGPFTAVGAVIKPGRRGAFAEGRVRNGAGRVVATATSSVLIVAMQPEVGGTAGRSDATSGEEIR